MALAEKLLVSLLKGIGITEEDEEFRNIYKSHVACDYKDGNNLKLNHYPKCPQPDKTLGVIPHSDLSILTILYQDEIGGNIVTYNFISSMIQTILCIESLQRCSR